MLVPPLDRRRFLKSVGGAAAAMAAAGAAPGVLLVKLGRRPEPVPPIQDSRLKDLADRALEAARSAGAAYADTRLTHTRMRRVFPGEMGESEDMEVGVRALVSGYWGFASGPVWSAEEMGRLGIEAVNQARGNALDGKRVVDLAPVRKVPSGHWTMPIARDGFDVSPFEIQDFLHSMEIVTVELPGGGMGSENWVTFQAQAKLLATSEGSYCTQQLYSTAGVFQFTMQVPHHGKKSRWLICLSPAGLGWELYTAPSIPQVRERTIYEEIQRKQEQIRADLMLPVKPEKIGRYDTVFDAVSIQNIAARTLGQATELDRAMGYDANEGGTSYLSDPLRMLGSYQAGAESLTLTANRSVPGGAATVEWDDEGVVPDECTLVKAGVLHDFQTTRESAGWLKNVYAAADRRFRSHGCAAAPSAMEPPIEHTPNLAVAPATGSDGYDELLAGVTDGLAIEEASADMDFQDSTGMGQGRVYEVKHGRKTARIAQAAFLFRSTEFWKALEALGGEASVRRYGRSEAKGAPPQRCFYSVSAPPARVKQISLINPLRKA